MLIEKNVNIDEKIYLKKCFFPKLIDKDTKIIAEQK
jgi:hypothetical protein